jgi:hypothetical protein
MHVYKTLLSIYCRQKNIADKANQNLRGTLFFTTSHSKYHEFSTYLRVSSTKLGLAKKGIAQKWSFSFSSQCAALLLDKNLICKHTMSHLLLKMCVTCKHTLY